ncbi:MAG: PD40 domain-containing protein [Chloroflexi bacterium]|nr:PD40 domain-containing protein [Chloroflexota bacterium]
MSQPSSNRTTWLLAGVVGCIVFCVAVALLGGAGFFFFGRSTLMPDPIMTPPETRLATALTPTVIATATLLPTVAPVASPTLIVLTPTLPATIPTVAVALPTRTTAPTRPTGKLAFSVNRGDPPPDKHVYIMNADGTGAKQILDRASSPVLSPDGTKIFYYHWEDGIFIANADGSEPHKIVGESNAKFLAMSHDGRWLAWTVQPSQSSPKSIDAVLPDGTGRRPIVNGGAYPAWSPDDTQIVYHSCRETMCGLFKAKSAGGDGVMFTSDVGSSPAWSPNGQRIVYTIEVNGVKQIFIINADGAGKRQLTTTPAHHVGANWSLDGNFIFYRSPEGGAWAIWRMNSDGTNPIKLIDNVPPTDEAFEKISVSK